MQRLSKQTGIAAADNSQKKRLHLSEIIWQMWRKFSYLAKANPGYPVTLPFTVTRRESDYVVERMWRFPGVQFEHVYQRTYPTLKQFGPIDPLKSLTAR